jgi:rod shape-determining protein MreB
MRGRDIVTGLPKEVTVDDGQIRKALARSVKALVNAIKGTIEETPPELVADIMQRGIFLVGGGSLLRGLDQLVAEQTEMPVKLVEDPLTAVVRGTGMVLEDIDALKDVLVSTQYEEPPR